MAAKRPTGERPKQLSKLASKVYMKETSSPSQAAARAGAARDKIKKSAPAKTFENGGKVSQAMLNKIKADGMQKAITKVATYKASPEYAAGVSRMYGEKRINDVYMIKQQPGKAVPMTGPKPKSILESATSGAARALKDIPKIPGAAAKTIAKAAKKPGRGN